MVKLIAQFDRKHLEKKTHIKHYQKGDTIYLQIGVDLKILFVIRKGMISQKRKIYKTHKGLEVIDQLIRTG